jgi:hypothetical protein
VKWLKRGRGYDFALSGAAGADEAPRNRRWARIADMDHRALRVILLEDGETIHNAFFDRDFKE